MSERGWTSRNARSWLGLLGALTALGPLVIVALLIGVTLVGAIESALRSEGMLAELGAATWVSAQLVTLAITVAAPLGIGVGILLEEYEQRTALGRVVEVGVRILAGVPPVVCGVFALVLFAGVPEIGLVAGALTLAIVALPMVVASTRTALQAVPRSLREAGLALAGGRWQVVRMLVLPAASRGMIVGVIRASARVLGEAAPLVVLGVALGRAGEAALPVRLFAAATPTAATVDHPRAASCLVVLLALVLALHGLAFVLERRRAPVRAPAPAGPGEGAGG